MPSVSAQPKAESSPSWCAQVADELDYGMKALVVLADISNHLFQRQVHDEANAQATPCIWALWCGSPPPPGLLHHELNINFVNDLALK